MSNRVETQAFKEGGREDSMPPSFLPEPSTSSCWKLSSNHLQNHCWFLLQNHYTYQHTKHNKECRRRPLHSSLH